MESRLEILRKEIDRLIMNGEPNKICMLSAHIYGVAKFCTLLAIKRCLNVELATTCGMLHDVYYTIDGTGNNHAEKGAHQAKIMLEATGAYSNDEIEIIVTAILKHSNKRVIDDCYDELLKDADVLDHCLYNNDFPIAEWEVERYNNLLSELTIK